MLLKNFKPLKIVQKAKVASGNSGFLTVINSKKNGRRVEFRKEVAEHLKIDDSIAVAYDDDSVIFYRPSEDAECSLRVKKSGERKVVYSGELVATLTEFFDLKFDKTVSYTFTEGKYEIIDEIGQKALVISKSTVKKNTSVEAEETIREVKNNDEK